MGWLLLHWRMVALGAALAGVLGFYGYLGHLKREAAQAKARAAQMGVQVEIDRGVAESFDIYTKDTATVREKARHAERRIRQAPSADQPLDPAFRAELCRSLGELRNSAVCTDDQGSGRMARGVP